MYGEEEDGRIPDGLYEGGSESVFDRCSWFYALCRERLFADHTEDIAGAVTPLLDRPGRPLLLEVGCGPGFYSSRLAKRFPQIDVIGVDPSARLLARARGKVRRNKLANCRFARLGAMHLANFPEAADFIVASRLFLILANRRTALEAIYITLKPSGLLFIAEPLSPLRAAVPLACMRLLQMPARAAKPAEGFAVCNVLNQSQFADFVASQPWKHVRRWSDQRYQYALCEKSA